MAGAEVLKEFLVRLAYQVDKTSQRSFTSGVADATTKIAGLGLAITGATAALAAYTNRAADAGERLYWLSQRSQTSAKGIEALGFAASQLGSSTEAAYGSIEAFGRFLQSSPGARTMVENYVGPFKDAEDALLKFSGRYKDTPAYFRNALGQAFGLDYNFIQSLFSGEFATRLQEQRDRSSKIGVDKDQFAKDATEFKQSWRDFWDGLNLISDRAAGELFAPMRREMEALNGALERNGADIGSGVASIMRTVIGELTGGITRIMEGVAVVKSLAAGDLDAAGAHAETFLRSYGLPVDSLLDKKTWQSEGGLKTGLRQFLGLEQRPVENTAEGAMRYFMAQGWTREQAAGIVANLDAESGLNPSAVGDSGRAFGIAQWHHDRQARFRERTGKPLQGSSFADQLAFVDWELRNSESAAGDKLRNARTAAQAGDVVSRYYERPKAADEAAFNRALSAERLIQQTNNITVNGASDPKETAGLIGREMERQNENLTRTLGTVFR